MAHFETLEYDIKQMLQGHSAPSSLHLEDATAKRIITLARNVALHTLDMVNFKPREPKDKGDVSIRMSEIGEPCIRKLLYKWYKPEYGVAPYAGDQEPFLPVKFTYGDYIEELTLFLASEAGHKVSERQEEVTFKGSEINITCDTWYAVGHIDAVIDDTVVDVKSAADGSFNKYKREGLTEATDTFGYLWQLDSYAFAKGTEKRAFVFTNKHDGSIHIIDRSNETLLPVTAMVNVIGAHANRYHEDGKLPERMPLKPSKYGSQLGTVCSYCAFKYACYDGNVTGTISSGRPMYFVTSELTSEGVKFVKEKGPIKTPDAYIPF